MYALLSCSVFLGLLYGMSVYSLVLIGNMQITKPFVSMGYGKWKAEPAMIISLGFH